MQAPQVLTLLLFLCLLSFCSSASAQSQDSLTRTTTILTETTVGKPMKTDKIMAYVNGHQTKIEVLSFFKPAEIEMKAEQSEERTSDYPIMNIRVKDKAHPVLSYFEQKAKLQYQGKLYQHNQIPDINPAKVSRVQYHQFKGTAYEGLLEDYLEVVLYGEEHVPHENTVYETAPRRINYYDVDGKILTQDKLPILKQGTFTSETLFGKEAVERYGDPKYADGIVIIRTKK